MTIDLESVEKSLYELRASCKDASFSSRSGVYAWFLKDKSALGKWLPVPSNGLIYVGSSKHLTARGIKQHLANTASSSFRRSLGAILKDKIGAAIPRTTNPLDQKRFTNFHFPEESEICLTKWMHESLYIGIFQCDEYHRVEEDLIAKMCPLLCLIGWDNPYRVKIKALRKACADEARTTA